MSGNTSHQAPHHSEQPETGFTGSTCLSAAAHAWPRLGLTSVVADGCWDGAQSLGISFHGQTLLASGAGSTLLHVLQQMTMQMIVL